MKDDAGEPFVVAIVRGASVHACSTAPEVDVGRTLAATIREALASAAGPPDRLYSDINGERAREHEFSYAVLNLAPMATLDLLAHQATATSWGDVGAATLPLAMATACYGPGATLRTLAWAGCASHIRGAVVVERGIR